MGYMASGKSVVGIELSKQLSLEFIDLDAYIEESEGMSISSIFLKKGEIYFRNKETLYLKEILSTKNNFILSLGGGTPCYGENMNIILEQSNSVYLRTSLNTLLERLKVEKFTRPIVASIEPSKLKEFIAKHLFERSYFYDRANHIVTTDEQSIKQIVNAIKIKLV